MKILVILFTTFFFGLSIGHAQTEAAKEAPKAESAKEETGKSEQAEAEAQPAEEGDEKKHRLPKKQAQDKKDSEEDRFAYLDEKRYGFHLHLISLPFIGGYGLDFQLNRKWTFALDLVNLGTDQDDFSISLQSTELRARYHPWGRRFFVGAGLGQQAFEADLTADIPVGAVELPTNFDVEANNTYIAPHFGWLSRWEMGLLIQIEFGARLPMGASSEVNVSAVGATDAQQDLLEQTDDYAENKEDAEDLLETFAKSQIPFFTLLTLGWVF